MNVRKYMWHQVSDMIDPLRQLRHSERVKAEKAVEEATHHSNREIEELRKRLAHLENESRGDAR